MLSEVKKLIKYGGQLEMIYISNEGMISQRRIRILKVNREVLQAYCYLRGANRTFKNENILAFVPVNAKKGVVV